MLETFGSPKFPQVRKFRSRVGEFRPHESFPIDQQTTKTIVFQCFKIDGGISWGRTFSTWGNFVGPGFSHTAKFRGHERFPIGRGERPTSPHWDDVGGKVSNHCEQFGATVVPTVGTSGLWFPTCLSHQIPLCAQSAHGSIPPPNTPNPTHHARHSHPPRPNQGRTLEGGSQRAVSSLAPPEWAAATPKRLGPEVYRVGIRI